MKRGNQVPDRNTDIGLKYLVRMTKSDYLHLGYWDPGEELTMENLRRAQERYIDHLIGFIPRGVKTILDVGCGVGGNAIRLRKEGYEVEALSPDPSQKEMFIQKTKGDIPFYLTRFEDFETRTKYDLILMSESVQYIKVREGFEKCRRCLGEGGFLLAADYYLKKPLSRDNVLGIGIPLQQEYLKEATEHGFKLIISEDITPYVTRTLDFGRLIYDSYAKPTIDLIHDVLRTRLPTLYKVGRFFVGKRITGLFKYEQLIDSGLFAEYRRYMVYLFQRS
jgi:MPBQ/MSBQ methyltransferase